MTQTLHIFHAGVVKKQVGEAIQRFRRLRPAIEVNAWAGGSVECARRALSGEPCDILILADDQLFPLLLDQLCDWRRIFAGNRMVLQATHADAPLNKDNWLQILTDPKTRIGHFDPLADPGGYRAVISCQLAEYVRPGLGRFLLDKPNRRVIRHGQEHEVDYIIYYYTAARQEANLPFVLLPEVMDLSSEALADIYATARVELAEGQVVRGTPIGHALAIMKSSPQPELAQSFCDEFLNCDFAAAGFIPRSALVHSGN